jgi:prophage maintenance system killer protein
MPEAYESLWLKTAALFESITLNHAFLDYPEITEE